MRKKPEKVKRKFSSYRQYFISMYILFYHVSFSLTFSSLLALSCRPVIDSSSQTGTRLVCNDKRQVYTLKARRLKQGREGRGDREGEREREREKKG